MTTGARTVRLLTLLGALGVTPVAWAQPAQPAHPAPAQPSMSERDQARQYALEGITANNRADWPVVIDRFERAERLFHAPIHLRYLAIGLERTNRLRESAETWRRLSQENLPADAPEPFRQAVAEAGREFPRLRARLGEITVTIANAPPDARVELDGHEVEPTALAASLLVDPGPHHLVAHAAGQPDIDRSVTVALGGAERVEIPFVAPHVVDLTPQVLPMVPRTTTVYRPNPLRTVGIVIASVGVAAVLGGVISGVMASGSYSTLQTNCPNFQCTTPDQLAQRDTVNTLAGASTGLLIAGGVVAVVGVVMAVVSGPRARTVQVGSNGHGFDLALHF